MGQRYALASPDLCHDRCRSPLIAHTRLLANCRVGTQNPRLLGLHPARLSGRRRALASRDRHSYTSSSTLGAAWWGRLESYTAWSQALGVSRWSMATLRASA